MTRNIQSHLDLDDGTLWFGASHHLADCGYDVEVACDQRRDGVAGKAKKQLPFALVSDRGEGGRLAGER